MQYLMPIIRAIWKTGELQSEAILGKKLVRPTPLPTISTNKSGHVVCAQNHETLFKKPKAKKD
jgi:hypothetical protein